MTALWSRVSRLRNRYFLAVDAVLLSLMPALALFIRTETLSSLVDYFHPLFLYTTLVVFLKLYLYTRTGLYSQFWAYASVDEMVTVVRSNAVAWGAELVVFFLILRPLNIVPDDFPRSIPFLSGLLSAEVSPLISPQSNILRKDGVTIWIFLSRNARLSSVVMMPLIG